MSYKFRSVYDLESVFIEKISEKYKLNERDLKKAFIKFDYDGNGLLDLNELGAAVRHYVNGVHPDQVDALMKAYDQNDDGMISYEELLYNFQHRSATKMMAENDRPSSSRSSNRNNDSNPSYYAQPQQRPSSSHPQTDPYYDNDEDVEAEDIESVYVDDDVDDDDWSSSKHSNHQPQHHDRRPSTSSSTASSIIDTSNPHDIQYRAKIFFQCFHQMLLKHASSSAIRSHSSSGSRKTQDHLLYTHQQYLDKESRTLLYKYFQPYLISSTREPSSSSMIVSQVDFCKVLRGLKLAGSNGLRSEVMDYIFNLCLSDDIQPSSSSYASKTNRVLRGGDAICSPTADIHVFADLIFGFSTSSSIASSSSTMRGNYVDTMDAGREVVGSGPFPMTMTAAGESATSLELASIPLRVISHKTRSSLKAPAAYSSQWLTRSAQPPVIDVEVEYVYGMSSSLQSGNTFHLLPSISSATSTSKRPSSSSSFLDSASIAYPAAALGVIHDLRSNSQRCYHGHRDDITCMTISVDGSIAATGCVASKDTPPLVHIWSTSSSCPLIRIIGSSSSSSSRAGFFSRSINALCFSADNMILAAVGCDDHHRMGLFEVSSGMMLAEALLQHGLPPQLSCLTWAPMRCYTDYITRQHTGICDLFASAGDHHLRLWSYHRSSSSSPSSSSPSLDYKAPTTAKHMKHSPPKVYSCCHFLSTGSGGAGSSDAGADLIAGGSNGYVYLYRQGECIAAVAAIKGGVSCMAILGMVVIVGGMNSTLRLYDGRSLTAISSINLLATSISSTRPSSSSSSQRRSASSMNMNRRSSLHDDTSSVISDASSKASSKLSSSHPTPSSSDVHVTGMVVVPGAGRIVQQQSYMLISLSSGNMIRVQLSSYLSSTSTSSSKHNPANCIQSMFYYHTGAVHGLAVDSGRIARVLASCGDDRRLLVWDITTHQAIAETSAMSAVGRCLCFDPSSAYLAVGDAAGGVTIYHLQPSSLSSSLPLMLSSSAYRRDSREEIGAISFSSMLDDASGYCKLAVGSHDNLIYLYDAHLSSDGGVEVSLIARLAGHSSFITHVDWSADAMLLQSTCGANELLCWDACAMKLDAHVNAADVKWHTHHCIYGFMLLGIWGRNAAGNDINAVDVDGSYDMKGGIVATADDFGCMNIYNYPCIVKNAPAVRCYGHSSHVMNVRVLKGISSIATVGGKDATMILWKMHDHDTSTTYPMRSNKPGMNTNPISHQHDHAYAPARSTSSNSNTAKMMMSRASSRGGGDSSSAAQQRRGSDAADISTSNTTRNRSSSKANINTSRKQYENSLF